MKKFCTDKSEDSEFMKAQIYIKNYSRDPARGWSSKPRPKERSLTIRDAPVKLKRQPIDSNRNKEHDKIITKNASNLLLASQVQSRPMTSNMSAISKMNHSKST